MANREVKPAQAQPPDATYFGLETNSAQIVGQPILAASVFQHAFSRYEDSRAVGEEPPERRLQAGLPAPRGQSKWHCWWGRRFRLPWLSPTESSCATDFSLSVQKGVILGLVLLTASCNVGPRYSRPLTPMTPA